jgi:hypothetical protein
MTAFSTETTLLQYEQQEQDYNRYGSTKTSAATPPTKLQHLQQQQDCSTYGSNGCSIRSRNKAAAVTAATGLQ